MTAINCFLILFHAFQPHLIIPYAISIMLVQAQCPWAYPQTDRLQHYACMAVQLLCHVCMYVVHVCTIESCKAKYYNTEKSFTYCITWQYYCLDGLLVMLSAFQPKGASSNPTCTNFFEKWLIKRTLLLLSNHNIHGCYRAIVPHWRRNSSQILRSYLLVGLRVMTQMVVRAPLKSAPWDPIVWRLAPDWSPSLWRRTRAGGWRPLCGTWGGTPGSWWKWWGLQK